MSISNCGSYQTVKDPLAMQETQETWVGSQGWENTLEKGMATHFSIFVWRIPWTEEPGGLQPMGSHSQDTTELLTLSPYLYFFRVIFRRLI